MTTEKSSLKFQATHRMLVNASITRGYNVVAIDVNNGTFKKDEVEQEDTKIRVNKGLVGEKLGYKGIALNAEESVKVGIEFNKKREELGFEAIAFFRVENAFAKSL